MELKTIYVEIKPLDNLFFRNGKPFTMGDESWAESSFLPNPSVVWGAFVSAILATGKTQLQDAQQLRLGNVFVYSASAKSIVVPAPTDFLEKDSKSSATGFPTGFKPANSLICSLPDNTQDWEIWTLLAEDKKFDTTVQVTSLEGKLVELSSLFIPTIYNFYGVANSNISSYPIETIAKPNPVIKIKRSRDTNSSENGYLYRTEFIEFNQECSLIAELYIPDEILPEKGFIKLGGEGKVASYKILDSNILTLPLKEVRDKNTEIRKSEPSHIKCVFTSPFVFEDSDLNTALGGYKGVKIVSMNLYKAKGIGGFDLIKPKPMLKSVPAGSIVIFERTEQASFDEYFNNFEKNSQQYYQQGFNQYFLIAP